MNAKVSMVMPVRNGAKHLDLMMESIFMQTYRNIEFIAAYDKSTDETLEILKKWKKIFLESDFDYRIVENTIPGGITAGLNAAIPYYTGDYITFPDADDYMFPDFVKTMVEELEENGKYGWACCDAIRIVENNNKTDDLGYKLCINSIYKDVDYPLHSLLDLEWRAPWNILVRKDFFDKVFPKKQIFPHPTSHEMAIKLPLLNEGEFLYVKQVLYKYILHDSGFVNTAMNNLMGSIRYLDSMQVCGEDVICSLKLSKEKEEKYIYANRINFFLNKAREAQHYNADYLRDYYINEAYKYLQLLKENCESQEGFNPTVYSDAFIECAAGIAVDIVPVEKSDFDMKKNIENRDFIIYGAGNKGKKYVKAICDLGYKPIEIWDAYAEKGMSINDIKVNRPHGDIVPDTPIFISVANTDLWPGIMDSLRKMNFCNIITPTFLVRMIRCEMLRKYFANSIKVIEDEEKI